MDNKCADPEYPRKTKAGGFISRERSKRSKHSNYAPTRPAAARHVV